MTNRGHRNACMYVCVYLGLYVCLMVSINTPRVERKVAVATRKPSGTHLPLTRSAPRPETDTIMNQRLQVNEYITICVSSLKHIINVSKQNLICPLALQIFTISTMNIPRPV